MIEFTYLVVLKNKTVVKKVDCYVVELENIQRNTFRCMNYLIVAS